MKRSILLLFVISILALNVFADIAAPSPKPTPKKGKEIDTYLSIRLGEQYKEAKLLIPRKQLKQLRAELEQLDNGEDDTASISESGSKGMQNVVAGVFLSLAFVFGGVWMFRSKAAKNTKIAGALLLVSLSGATVSFVFANAGPPAEARSITSKMFSKALSYYNFGGGKIKLVVVDGEENPELQVPLIKEEPTPKPSDE